MLGTITRPIVDHHPAPSDRAASDNVCRSMAASAESMDSVGERQHQHHVHERQGERRLAEKVSDPRGTRCAGPPRSPGPGWSTAAGTETPRTARPSWARSAHPDHRRHQQNQHRDDGEHREQQARSGWRDTSASSATRLRQAAAVRPPGDEVAGGEVRHGVQGKQEEQAEQDP